MDQQVAIDVTQGRVLVIMGVVAGIQIRVNILTPFSWIVTIETKDVSKEQQLAGTPEDMQLQTQIASEILIAHTATTVMHVMAKAILIQNVPITTTNMIGTVVMTVKIMTSMSMSQRRW